MFGGQCYLINLRMGLIVRVFLLIRHLISLHFFNEGIKNRILKEKNLDEEVSLLIKCGMFSCLKTAVKQLQF